MQNTQQPVWRVLGYAMLSAFTLLALMLRIVPARTYEAFAVLDGAAVWALAAFALYALYGAVGRVRGGYGCMRLWVLSALFAGVIVLGRSFAEVGTAELVTDRKVQALLCFAGRVPLYYAAMRLLLSVLTCLNTQGNAREWSPPVLGGALLLCWLPWISCLWPGTVSNDSISQLREIMGIVPLSNANPIFQTGLVAAFRQIGLWLGSADAGVALYCVVQAVLMAWLLGSLLAEMLKSNAPRWLCWLSMAFYAFCPVFPVFAFCIGKDTNFAMAVLFLSLSVRRVVHASGTPRAGLWVGLCASAVLCVLLRNAGVFLALLTLALLLWRSLTGRRRARWQLPACAVACVAVAYAALHLLVIPGLDIAPMPATENYSVPLQQVARVAAGGALTAEEWAAVDGVLEADALKQAYNGELSDPVKALWRKDATEQSISAFWRMWPRIVLNHPATCLSATFHNVYGYLYPGFMSLQKVTMIVGDQSTRTASVKGLYDYSINPRAEALESFLDRLVQEPLYRVLVSPGLYGWIALFAVACLLGKRCRGELLCAVPALFTLAGCALSAVNGYFRYAMPLYLCAPLLLWLVATAGGKALETR